jgi:hypothetical protein
MKLAQWPAILLAITAATDAFTPTPLKLTKFASSFTHQTKLTARRQHARNPMQLNMMFDQLTSALTDVAKNFGPKKR